MTFITIREKGTRKQIKLNGHAEYAEMGKDIVCASLSALTFSWANLVNEMEKDNKLKIIKMDFESGKVNIVIDDPMEYTYYAFEMLKGGLKAIADKYPKNILLEWGEKGK